MRILTDITPDSPTCPDPRAAWRPVSEVPSIAAHFFASGVDLFETEVPSEAGFPLVLWRREARRSQMDWVREAGDDIEAIPPRLAAVASEGQGFRGHFDRRWVAEPGNLQVAVRLAEPLPVARAGMGHAMLGELALAASVRDFVDPGRSVAIKWMNDILLDGAKVGGALTATRTRGGEIEEAVLGLGLNVACAPAIPADVFVPRVTCLGDQPLANVLERLLSHLDALHDLLARDGATALADRYRAQSCVIGQEVRILDDGPGLDDLDLSARPILARGTVEAIGDDLRLRIGGEWIGRGRLAFESEF